MISPWRGPSLSTERSPNRRSVWIQRSDIRTRFGFGFGFSRSDLMLILCFAAFQIINDRETGRSRGFGFVTFASEQAMRDAIEGMNGQTLDGRQITVNEAQSRGSGGGSRGGYGGGQRSYGGGGGGGYGGNRGYGGGGGGYGGRREGGYGGGDRYSRGNSDGNWRS
ncbi:hypothetical protein Cgig2_032514 [Carnegiea gigantea]|uniref:RRM domain-containing protein n=1 Tax=Carnegiea gigantea TaxID=171969 RepID=A0A9Q1KWC1_9CARY|nr:hypothetical protein Cgig2_032514 [Carnegiea gigantea]